MVVMTGQLGTGESSAAWWVPSGTADLPPPAEGLGAELASSLNVRLFGDLLIVMIRGADAPERVDLAQQPIQQLHCGSSGYSETATKQYRLTLNR
jgi:hypothetical protein